MKGESWFWSHETSTETYFCMIGVPGESCFQSEFNHELQIGFSHASSICLLFVSWFLLKMCIENICSACPCTFPVFGFHEFYMVTQSVSIFCIFQYVRIKSIQNDLTINENIYGYMGSSRKRPKLQIIIIKIYLKTLVTLYM